MILGKPIVTMEPTKSPIAEARSVENVGVSPMRCINPASEVNARLDTQVEVRVYPCNNSQNNGKKKFTTFNVKPEVSWSIVTLICDSL